MHDATAKVKGGLRPLHEEFGAIGVDPSETMHLAGISLTPERAKAMTEDVDPGTTQEADPYDGPQVTEALLRRIQKLPFDRMTTEDFDEVIESLKSKAMPDDADPKLVALAEDVAKRLVEGRFKKMVTATGKIIKKAILTGKEKLKGILFRRRNKSKIRSQRRKYSISSAFQRLKKLASRGNIVQKKARLAGNESYELVNELHAMLAEEGIGTGAASIRESVLSRIGRIFLLMSDEFQEEAVDEVMATCADKLAVLQESELTDADFMAAVRPAVKMITRMYSELESGRVQRDPGLSESEIDAIVAKVPDAQLALIAEMSDDEVGAWVDGHLETYLGNAG